MTPTTRPLLAWTASDLMSRDVVTMSQDTPLRAAAKLFSQRQVAEAAVVDADGRYVGMLSATDLLRWALQEAGGPGRHTAVCRQREGVVSDWQQVSGGGHASAVRRYITAESTVEAEAPLSALARAVVEAHVHRLIVVDEQHRPIGTVSCLDVLAALDRPVHSAAGG